MVKKPPARYPTRLPPGQSQVYYADTRLLAHNIDEKDTAPDDMAEALDEMRRRA
jgi:hypothetical protein